MNTDKKIAPLTQIGRRFVLTAGGAFFTSLFFASCGQKQSELTSNTAQASNQIDMIKVGVTGIVSEDILKFVNKNFAPQEKLKIEVVKFNDWIQPNTALRDKP